VFDGNDYAGPGTYFRIPHVAMIVDPSFRPTEILPQGLNVEEIGRFYFDPRTGTAAEMPAADAGGVVPVVCV
jgi:hypothetical protein